MLVPNTFRWSEGNYDPIFLFTLDMTNAHILKQPLRADDGVLYGQFLNRRAEIVEATVEKRKHTQECYRARGRARLTPRLATRFIIGRELRAGVMETSSFDD